MRRTHTKKKKTGECTSTTILVANTGYDGEYTQEGLYGPKGHFLSVDNHSVVFEIKLAGGELRLQVVYYNKTGTQ